VHSVRQDLSIEPPPDFWLVTLTPEMRVRTMLCIQASIEQATTLPAFMMDLVPRSCWIDGASYVVLIRVLTPSQSTLLLRFASDTLGL
jgi:hypothetical protein